jgi:hypothetical protein
MDGNTREPGDTEKEVGPRRSHPPDRFIASRTGNIIRQFVRMTRYG